ncbi:MAG: TolC family protein [Bacteroidales bacterium]|nr:TolC family protein [Bacteroidales bacterium]
MKSKIIISAILLAISSSSFGQVMTLDSCKNIAIANNNDLESARQERDAAKRVKQSAFTNYFPQISAGAFVSKFNDNMIEYDVEIPPEVGMGLAQAMPALAQLLGGIDTHIGLVDHFNIAEVSAIEPIYLGGRVRYGNKLAKVGEDVADMKLNLATEQTLAKTEQLYWQILALKEKRNTIDNYCQYLDNLEKDAQNAFDAHVLDKSNLLKVKLEKSKIKSKKLQLENGIDLLLMSLAQHIGVAYSDSFDIADSEINVVSPSEIIVDNKDALNNRYEYQMLSKSVQAEELRYKMVRGENLPSIAVGATGMYLDFMEDNDMMRGMIWAGVQIPISQWWSGSHKMKEQKIKADLARTKLDNSSELMTLQMDKTACDLNQSFAEIEVAESLVNEAEEHYKIVKDNYDAGILSMSDLLEAQATLQSAKDNLSDSKAQYMIKANDYLTAIGKYNR